MKVEFKYVNTNNDAKVAFEIGLVPKHSFLISKEEGPLWFNGINLSDKLEAS